MNGVFGLMATIGLIFPSTPQTKLYQDRVKAVTQTRGLVAFWDFVKREPSSSSRFTAHVPKGAKTDYPLDAANYVLEYWGEGRQASYADFPLLNRGPFGQAIRIKQEPDPIFRPFLFVPRSRLHDTPLDIKGKGKSVTVVVWAIRESGNHALAGIWHEGTDLKQDTTQTIKKVERGQRQYALFAGLYKEGAAAGHVSENGASSFADKYAQHKSTTSSRSPKVPADSAAESLDKSWTTFAFTFDNARDEAISYLDGVASENWQDDVKKRTPFFYNAWMAAQYPDRYPTFPKDQTYFPPEGKPLSVKLLRETEDTRVELHEFRYTRVEVTLKKVGGKWETTNRELAEMRINPYWFPYDLYSPLDAVSGGPFTIGRVIHSSRSVGFTGWIGGVAVFDRALSAREIAALSSLARGPVVVGGGGQ